MDKYATCLNYHLSKKFPTDTNVINVESYAFHFNVKEDRLTMYVGSDQSSTFRVVGAYSADHNRSKYSEVFMTAEFDRCARVALKKGASNNPKAEAENALKNAGIGQSSSDPFGNSKPDPFSSGDSDDPFNTSSAGASNSGSVNASGIVSWEDTAPISVINNSAIDSRLFATDGNHTIRPNNFNSLSCELPLTLDDAKAIYKIAQALAPTELILKHILLAGGAMRGVGQSWTKSSFHGSISAAQNKDRAGYDYFAVCTAFMNAAMQFYKHVGRFTVVPST